MPGQNPPGSQAISLPAHRQRRAFAPNWGFYEAVLFRACLELLVWRRSVTTLVVDHDVATPVQKHCAAGLLAVSKFRAVALRRELARGVLT